MDFHEIIRYTIWLKNYTAKLLKFNIYEQTIFTITVRLNM